MVDESPELVAMTARAESLERDNARLRAEAIDLAARAKLAELALDAKGRQWLAAEERAGALAAELAAHLARTCSTCALGVPRGGLVGCEWHPDDDRDPRWTCGNHAARP